MKTFLIPLFILLSTCTQAQIKPLDLHHAKYIESAYKNNYIGNWRSENSTFKVTITKEKKHIQKGNVDVYADALKVKINKFIENGEEIADRLTSTMILLSFGTDDFNGVYKDAITSNNVNIVLTRISDGKLLLTIKLPEIDVENNNKKGTAFSDKVILLKD